MISKEQAQKLVDGYAPICKYMLEIRDEIIIKLQKDSPKRDYAGLCRRFFDRKKPILIFLVYDVHSTDEQFISTLLHEMIHAKLKAYSQSTQENKQKYVCEEHLVRVLTPLLMKWFK